MQSPRPIATVGVESSQVNKVELLLDAVAGRGKDLANPVQAHPDEVVIRRDRLPTVRPLADCLVSTHQGENFT